jgi:E3 ubiquitin-protein ligase TRIP12
MLAGPNAAAKILMVKSDSREEILHEDCRLASTFIKTLFSVLYEVYSSSAGPSVRHKCLQAIMRMIYYASPDLLNTILASSNVSSHVAAMMASPDLKIVVASIQMANILMDKLPNVFGVYFCREGVMHQIKKLCEPEVIDLSAKKTNATATTSSTSLMSPLASSLVPSAAEAGATVMASEVAAVLPGSSSAESLVPPAYSERMLMSDAVFLGPSSSSPDSFNSGGIGKAAPGGSADGSSGLSSPRMRLSSVLKHKKPLKRGGGSSGRKPSKSDPVPTSSSATTSAGMDLYSAVGEPFMVATVGRGTSPATDVTPPPPRGKWSSASMGKSSFLSGLHPSRWGRASSMGPDRPVPPVPATMGLSHLLYHEPMMTTHHHMSTAPPTCPNANVVIDNREKIKQWISEQATKFSDKYYGTDSHGSGIHPAMNNLNQLCTALSSLTASNGLPSEVSSLQLIAGILTDTDMSPFEMIHSGLVGVFLSYLTISDTTARDDRLRRFLQVFLGQQVEEAKSSLDIRSCNIQPFSAFVSKLMNCFHHLEQFQVKVHDLPGGSGTPGRSSNALKFFDTHQLKCNLQRHVSCTNLKQWHGGPVKIDPLALVQAIERYLVMRGYGRIRQNADNDCSDDDDGSDDDIDDTMAAMSISHGTGRHRIELLINDHVLPYGMTVYEAVKQFSNLHDRDGADTDTDTETPFGSAAIWINTHTIWFRSVSETDRQPDTGSSPRKMKSDRRRPASKSHRGGSSNDSSDSCVTRSMSALEAFLMPSLPSTVTIKDPSLEVLALLRLLHGINCHWNTLFDKAVGGDMLISAQEFVSSKLTAKANRQLQDPLVIMTGNMPQWLTQIARACPFLLPFDTRLSLFYATSFDRDRAMHRLQDAAHENAPSDSSDRVTPRLERKKSMISREDILKQAEKVLSDIGGSRAILEIQYENEVGTGLGPTLEFYALVSRELQRVDLDMWRGEVMQSSKSAKAGGEDVPAYMFNASGLFPSPLARNAKVASVNKIKSKFRLLGKFMAKALMDSRMLDLPLSEVFYKWMLGCEPTLQADDLRHICPVFAESFAQLRDVLRQKKCIEADKSHTTESRHLALSSLTLNGGGTVEDLDLDFVLPGYPNIELKKGGKDIHVTLDNLEEYLRLVTRWTLVEGTQRQFEAFREGFESLFPLSTLSLFYPSEMDQLFCGSSYEPWSIKYLMESCRPDHGYTLDSQAIRFLFEILSVYNGEEQRQFLQFMTGSPRLPVGGLKSLNPPLTIVRKTVEANENADDFLPSVMTCVNYLKLPDYTNIAIMRARLATAASEGQLSFHLS